MKVEPKTPKLFDPLAINIETLEELQWMVNALGQSSGHYGDLYKPLFDALQQYKPKP